VAVLRNLKKSADDGFANVLDVNDGASRTSSISG
jgi:hypothetical protein